MKLELVATATFGLEAVVRREIEALGYKIIKTEDGRVTYMGDERAVVRSNLWLRCADRVYVRMGEFKATDFEELFPDDFFFLVLEELSSDASLPLSWSRSGEVIVSFFSSVFSSVFFPIAGISLVSL